MGRKKLSRIFSFIYVFIIIFVRIRDVTSNRSHFRNEPNMVTINISKIPVLVSPDYLFHFFHTYELPAPRTKYQFIRQRQ